MNVRFLNSTGVSYTKLKKVASNDCLRPVLNGAYVDFKNSCLVVTDAHIIIVYPIEILENDTELNGIIVPLNLFNELRYMEQLPTPKKRLLPVNFVLTENYAEAHWLGEMVFRAKYIEGKYPEYEHVLPKKEQISEIAEIGINANIVERFTNAIKTPLFPYGNLKLNFVEVNKGILVETIDVIMINKEPKKIKGTIMPVQI